MASIPEAQYLRSQWRLCKAGDLDCVIYETQTAFLEAICGLDETTEYCLKLRHLDANFGWSDWSDDYCFTTPEIIYVLRAVVNCGEESFIAVNRAVVKCGEETWLPIVNPGRPFCGMEEFAPAAEE